MIQPLSELITRILEEHSPGEVSVFKAVGKELIANGLKGHRNTGSELTEYDFAPDLESGVLLLHLVAGTLALIDIYVAGKRLRDEKLHEAETQAAWEEFLIQNNVPRFLATQIRVRHGGDLFRIITTHKENEDKEKEKGRKKGKKREKNKKKERDKKKRKG